ncbi:Uncharacterized protein OS=Sorangium cellulosum (strain So ce56) GN=sce5710 PE=4 SV=1 [Gemmata massiliana]|uniref:Uncharacterized protein n=1 Tax=Gemmata massiliana TaxID=1210884 RepID=A0A6P2CX22_9BACT|nr:hypothetical protein [Gemmata massiliana]VTR93499.1 Uncharacterized protein OS=Sorangium cellulosum (strain So ce56) GN=sce5710 PE=4 SV=1 [Gemmata massiliana]
MTEADWNKSNDVEKLVAFVRRRFGPRKLRLFGCACCRSVWDYIDDETIRRGVECAERCADGDGPADELEAVTAAVKVVVEATPMKMYLYQAVADLLEWKANHTTALDAARRVGITAHQATGTLETRGAQPGFLRDLFGPLPFRPIPFDPAWGTSTVTALARDIYAQRAFDRMPILADALQDAGCDNDDILNHCRTPGVHVHGCWVVDLVLEKK